MKKHTIKAGVVNDLFDFVEALAAKLRLEQHQGFEEICAAYSGYTAKSHNVAVRFISTELNNFLKAEEAQGEGAFFLDNFEKKSMELASGEKKTSFYIQCSHSYNERTEDYKYASIEINVMQVATASAHSAIGISLWCE